MKEDIIKIILIIVLSYIILSFFSKGLMKIYEKLYYAGEGEK